MNIQGKMANKDELVVSLRNFRFKNITPNNDAASFIAPNATILGDSRVGHRTSVFYGAQLRGDVCPIRIGDKCFIGDNAKIGLLNLTRQAKGVDGGNNNNYSDMSTDLTSSDMTSASDKSDKSENSSDSDSEDSQYKKSQYQFRVGVVIMDNVVIGNNAVIEDDVVIGNNCVVGANAIIKAGTVLEPYSIVAPGSVVIEDTLIKTDSVYSGSPAEFNRNVTPQERDNHDENIKEYVDLALCHAYETEKSYHEQVGDYELKELDDELDANMKVQMMTQLRDITRVKKTSTIIPALQSGYLDDDYSHIVPDDFKVYNQLEESGFGTEVSLNDDHRYFEGHKGNYENFDAYDKAKAQFENEDWSKVKAKSGPSLHPQDLSSVINWGDDVWEKKWYDMNKYSIKSSGHPSGHGGW